MNKERRIMEASKFIGKVLKDGHLSLPEEVSKQK
jgi:hypothetical protein